MASLNEFSRRMAIRANRVNGNTTRLVRKVALAADQAVVSGTPVDTGRAKSNWLVQIGAQSSSTIDAYVPGQAGSTAAANETAAQAQAETVISQYMSGFDRAIYITNNLPYIGELNDGSSTQAPKNFVEEAVADAVAAINSSRIIDP